VTPALGGSERRVYTGPRPQWAHCNRMDWSPDGKSLVFPEPIEDGTRGQLTLLALSDLTTRPLTSPSNQQFDCQPTFSPDGSTVAFVRGGRGAFLGDLYVQTLSGGNPVRLTSGNSGGELSWTQDSTEIVFSSSVGGRRALWRIRASGGSLRPFAGAGENAWWPTISRAGNQLAYWVWNQTETIWRLDLKDELHAAGPPVRLLSGRGYVWKPDFSPDGKKIAFESNRMGYADIWVCDNDGSNCSQLSSLHGMANTARWSPDGHYIAFEAITKDFYDVYLLEYPGGTPHVLQTFPGANNGIPRWSRDGQWIYFYSDHEKGNYQLWKIPSKGGTPIRVRTSDGGIYVAESLDRHVLYYSKWGYQGVWRMPLEGGQETRILEHTGFWDWTLTASGIYFIDFTVKPYGRIEFFDFASRSSTPIFAIGRPLSLFGGLTLSPDRKSLVFGQNELDESYIMLVKNFR